MAVRSAHSETAPLIERQRQPMEDASTPIAGNRARDLKQR